MIITLTFDTSTKGAKATVDGNEVPNLSSVQLYGGYKGKYSLELSTAVMSEDEDMGLYTRICASKSDSPDLVDKDVKVDDETEQEVLKYFGIEE